MYDSRFCRVPSTQSYTSCINGLYIIFYTHATRINYSFDLGGRTFDARLGHTKRENNIRAFRVSGSVNIESRILIIDRYIIRVISTDRGCRTYVSPRFVFPTRSAPATKNINYGARSFFPVSTGQLVHNYIDRFAVVDSYRKHR